MQTSVARRQHGIIWSTPNWGYKVSTLLTVPIIIDHDNIYILAYIREEKQYQCEQGTVSRPADLDLMPTLHTLY